MQIKTQQLIWARLTLFALLRGNIGLGSKCVRAPIDLLFVRMKEQTVHCLDNVLCNLV